MPRPGRWRVLADLDPQPGDVCACKHAYDQHVRGSGRCTQADSYGLPCECPSMAVDAVYSDRQDELTDWEP